MLVGVGAVPNDELARDAGLDCDGGIVVDLAARTADPAIFAIGDCTQRPLPLYGRMVRLESVPNALEQAKQAAADICGRPPPTPEVPWFWSDQYDLRLQIAGLPFDVPPRSCVRGDPARRGSPCSTWSGRPVQAVEAVNAPAEFMGGPQLIGERKPCTPAEAARPGTIHARRRRLNCNASNEGDVNAEDHLHRARRHRARRSTCSRACPSCKARWRTTSRASTPIAAANAPAPPATSMSRRWLAKTGAAEPGSQEASMLSFAAVDAAELAPVLPDQVSEALDGLVVRMPEGQH